MNPELQQIINEMAVGGASQQEINEVARRYEAGLPLYGDQPVMSGFQQDIARKRSRGRNPFLNILGEIGDFTGLTKEMKLSIVGQLIGQSPRICSDDVYSCMIDMHDNKQKITIRKLSELLDVSSRTVYRVMCDDLRREKELLNIELKKMYEKV